MTNATTPEVVDRAPRWYDLDASLTFLAATYSRYFGVCACCPHGSWLPGFGTKATHVCECVPEMGAIRLCAEHHEVLHSGEEQS